MIRVGIKRLAQGVVMAVPSPRVRVVWHHNAGNEHVVAYLGSVESETAESCYRYLVERVGRYDRQASAGVNKPRKASRVEGCQLEIKWHSPHAGILVQVIEKDLARTAAHA